MTAEQWTKILCISFQCQIVVKDQTILIIWKWTFCVAGETAWVVLNSEEFCVCGIKPIYFLVHSPVHSPAIAPTPQVYKWWGKL